MEECEESNGENKKKGKMLSHSFYGSGIYLLSPSTGKSSLTMFSLLLCVLKELTINPLYRSPASSQHPKHETKKKDAITITKHVILLQAKRETNNLWSQLLK